MQVRSTGQAHLSGTRSLLGGGAPDKGSLENGMGVGLLKKGTMVMGSIE